MALRIMTETMQIARVRRTEIAEGAGIRVASLRRPQMGLVAQPNATTHSSFHRISRTGHVNRAIEEGKKAP
jgi:hypothetical protein